MPYDFPFTIRDVADLLNLQIKHKNAVGLDVNCPFCGDRKGKMNLNLKSHVFHCNRCGEGGGVLELYGRIYGISRQDAYAEICEKLRLNEKAPDYEVKKKIIQKEPDIPQSKAASKEEKDAVYTMLLSLLTLSDIHREHLLKRGFSEAEIQKNGYKSTPVFGFRKLTDKLLDAGLEVAGVPGFHKDKEGKWTVHFHPKSSGFLIPVRNIDGLITGMQIRLDHPADGRKYIWMSSSNYPYGASSGSPIHLAGEPGEKVLYVTEGPLKGDLAHFLSGKTFACVAGVNQYGNLPDFLSGMKRYGTKLVYETYDMDKRMKLTCQGDYNEDCVKCPCYKKDWKNQMITCERKQLKRSNIQRGCRRLSEVLQEVGLSGKSLTWDMNSNGEWNGKIKGVDDYLVDLQKRNK